MYYRLNSHTFEPIILLKSYYYETDRPHVMTCGAVIGNDSDKSGVLFHFVNGTWEKSSCPHWIIKTGLLLLTK
jgi:hypothetical protein